MIVAAFAPWHEQHATAIETMKREPGAPVHAALEAYAVLTRLPPPHRAEAGIVADYLERRFIEPLLVLPEGEQRAITATLSKLGVSGGPAYDALIALTVRHFDGELLSLDHRASSTYRRCGVAFRLL